MPFLKPRNKISRSQQLINSSNKNGLRHAIFNIESDKYIGEWKDNEKEGKGALLTRSFKLYEGDWYKGYRHGFGVLAYRAENKVFLLIYRGEWKFGRMHGYGARHYPDGSYYLGNFKMGYRHGYGQMWYADGSFYDGDWIRDKRDGFGMMVRDDGNRYEGEWSKDMKHGKGRFFHLSSGQMHEGIWDSDVCVFSVLMDIPFRQTAIKPTPYPMPKLELINSKEICESQTIKALSGKLNSSCLELRSSSIMIDVHDSDLIDE